MSEAPREGVINRLEPAKYALFGVGATYLSNEGRGAIYGYTL